MKTFLRLSLLAGLALGAVASVLAGPGPQHWQTLRTEAQFKAVAAGDKVAIVCNRCKTVSEQTLATPAEAMALAQEGATIVCPACHAVSKVTMKGPARNPSIGREVVYVDDHGAEFLFVAKVTPN